MAGILALVLVLFTIFAVAMLFYRFSTDKVRKIDRAPGLAYKLYLFFTVLLGQTLVVFSSYEIPSPWDISLVCTLFAWCTVSVLAMFTASIRWAVSPVLYIVSCVVYFFYATASGTSEDPLIRQQITEEQNLATLRFGIVVIVEAALTLLMTRLQGKRIWRWRF